MGGYQGCVTVVSRRMTLAGHCHRYQELPASNLVLWEPTHGYRLRGRPTPTYVDILSPKPMYMDILRKNAGVESMESVSTVNHSKQDDNGMK